MKDSQFIIVTNLFLFWKFNGSKKSARLLLSAMSAREIIDLKNKSQYSLPRTFSVLVKETVEEIYILPVTRMNSRV